MSKFLTPAVHGQKFGCSDSGAPETHTPEELSRLYDAMHAAAVAGLNHVAVFGLAPKSMMLEFNYSKWAYVAPGGVTESHGDEKLIAFAKSVASILGGRCHAVAVFAEGEVGIQVKRVQHRFTVTFEAATVNGIYNIETGHGWEGVESFNLGVAPEVIAQQIYDELNTYCTRYGGDNDGREYTPL